MTALPPTAPPLRTGPADPVPAPPYPTGPRRYNRVGGLGLVLAVGALVAATLSVSALALAAVAGGVSWLGTRRVRRPTTAAWCGVGVSAVAVVLALVVAAG